MTWGVPRFALLETRGPDPRALLLSTLILAALVSLSFILGSIPNVTRVPQAETVTLLVAPPEPPTCPMKNFDRGLEESPGAQTVRRPHRRRRSCTPRHPRPNHALLTWLTRGPSCLNSSRSPRPLQFSRNALWLRLFRLSPPAAREAPKPDLAAGACRARSWAPAL